MKKLKLNLDEIDVESFEISNNFLRRSENDLQMLPDITLDPAICGGGGTGSCTAVICCPSVMTCIEYCA